MIAADYDRLARIHRPSNPAVLAMEMRRLHANGLTARDIAAALRLDIGQVLEALTAPNSPAVTPAAVELLSSDISAAVGGGRSLSEPTTGETS